MNVSVLWHFLAMPRVGKQCVILVFLVILAYFFGTTNICCPFYGSDSVVASSLCVVVPIIFKRKT